MPYYTLDDFINDKLNGFTSLDYFTQQRKPFLSLDEFTAERMGIDYKKFKDLQRYKQVEEDHRGIAHILEQFGRGLAKEATFGFSPKLIGEEEPVGTGEQIARGAGSLVGFLAPYGVAAKGVSKIGKALGLTTKLIKASPYAKELAVMGRVGRSATTLGLASAMSDIPSAIADPMGAAKRAKEGAMLGTIFGGAGLAHIESHKALSWMLRQFGGRAAMLAVGMYGPETLEKKNLAQTVFSEALNTMFLHHGITPKMLLEGKFNTPDQKALYEMMDADTIHVNEHTAALSKMRIPFAMFQKGKVSTKSLFDIEPSVDVGIVNKAIGYKNIKDSLKEGKAPRPLKIVWNPKKGEFGKYEPINEDNELFVALLERYTEKGIANETRTQEIKVEILQDKGKQTGMMLPRPIENAMKFFAPKVVDERLDELFKMTRYWKYNIDTRQLTPTPRSQQASPGKIQVGPRDVLLQRSDFDKANAKWNLTPVVKGKQIPSFEWNARKVFSKHIDDQLYKSMEGDIDTWERTYPGLKTGDLTSVPPDVAIMYDNAKLNLYNMYKHNVMMEEPIQQQILRDMESGKISKKWKGIDKIVVDAERRLKLLYNIPNRKLPDSYTWMLEERADNLNAGINLRTIQESLGIKGTLKVKDLMALQEKFFELEKMPLEDRNKALGSTIMEEYGLTHPSLTGQERVKQEAVESLERKRRKDILAKALWKAKNEPGAGSVIKQLLTVDRPTTWLDFNKFTSYIQVRTGIPLHDLYRWGHKVIGDKKTALGKYTEFLNKYAGMPAEEQAQIYVYYNRLFNLKSVRDLALNEKQLSYIRDIDKTMEDLAPLIIEERFKMWLETVYYPELAEERPITPAAKAFRMQNDPDIRGFLFRGADRWLEFVRTKDRSGYDAWVQEAIDRGIGTISKGIYLPEFIAKIPIEKDKVNLLYEYEASNIGFVGKGHFKSRTKIQDRFFDVDLLDSLADEFRDKNLNVRVHAYINQVLNVKYVEPYLDAMERVINMYGDAFKEAKPPGMGRKGVEAKGISMLDYFRLYAHRIKGYPIKIGPIGEQLRFIQSAFFRSLVVRPFLILRNIPQRWVTAPHKSNVLDPRYLLQKRFSFNALPEAVRERYASTVSQLSVFRQDYLQLMESEKMKTWPFIGTFVKLAENVGKLYSLSDEYNRRYVFSKTFFRAKDYINKYISQQISQDALDKELGIGKMESTNQRAWRELIQARDVDGAATHLAEWTDMNTNWMYGRTEKSLPEMTGEGESWTNLLTWSKSIVQWMTGSAQSARDGVNMMIHNKPNTPEFNVGRQKMYDGAGKMVGLLLCGGIANSLLNTVSFQVKPKFQSYGTDMFMWELGGVSLDIVKSFTDDLAAVITSIDGTPEERKAAMDKAMKDLDTIAIRQMLPFSKNALSVIESFTGRSFISPLYEKWTKLIYGYPKQQTYVQRTMLEGIAHAVFSTDPNKTEDVRKYVFKKMTELDIKRREKGVFQPLIELMYQQYKRNNEMLMRYTPYELLKDIEKREYDKMYEQMKGQDSYTDWLYQSQKQQYREQRDYGQQ